MNCYKFWKLMNLLKIKNVCNINSSDSTVKDLSQGNKRISTISKKISTKMFIIAI